MIRQVGDHVVRGRHNLRQLVVERVAFDQAKAAWGIGICLGERDLPGEFGPQPSRQAPVELDRGDRSTGA